ncbi:hypothetical protein ANRL4_01874 [Anaerolineae bacterium]|nr:hypothetical protein ANRL4_01874 [Anaerolineae bacterium]
MSAKITLIGQPQGVQVKNGIVSFTITTGPASSTAPKGLKLFKSVAYHVECSERQYHRGRADGHDKSELILEGYLEPRLDETGKLYVAVVALSVISKQVQHSRKVEQLREETIKAEEAYEQACEQFGVDSAQAQSAAEAFEKVKAGWLKLKAAQAA